MNVLHMPSLAPEATRAPPSLAMHAAYDGGCGRGGWMSGWFQRAQADSWGRGMSAGSGKLSTPRMW